MESSYLLTGAGVNTEASLGLDLEEGQEVPADLDKEILEQISSKTMKIIHENGVVHVLIVTLRFLLTLASATSQVLCISLNR